MTKAWWLLVVCALSPVACAQIAGLDDKYTSAADEDAGADASRDVPADAAPADAREEPAPDLCGDLDKSKNPCGECVLQGRNRGACGGACFFGTLVLRSYLACLEGADPKQCVDKLPEKVDLATRVAQKACIADCQTDLGKKQCKP